MTDTRHAVDPYSTGVHLAHCFQGEYRHTCAYGDRDCPAAVHVVPDHPNDRTLDLEDRAFALVRYLAASTDQAELEQAREWACQMRTEMED